MKIKPCLSCGFCCKKSPCPFGEWDEKNSQCMFLEIKKDHRVCIEYKCDKYDYIQKLPEESAANFSPAFGSGCCMTLFNEDRNRLSHHLSVK